MAVPGDGPATLVLQVSESGGRIPNCRIATTGNDFGRAVSRILSTRPAEACQGENHLSQQPVPGTHSAEAETDAGRVVVPYLALLPMGFSVPRRLLAERWALTPPFHPCRSHTVERRYFLCGTFRQRSLATALPASIPHPWVTRHRALRSSDFPPRAEARSDSPPFQDRPLLCHDFRAFQAQSP